MKSISIVIVSFNTRELLRTCLISTIMETRGLESEIIVIDNDSSDGSAVLVEREFPHVQLIKAGQNLGFAAANNLGFKKAEGEFIVLLNSDAFIKPNSLKKAVQKMKQHKRAGIGGAKLMAQDGFLQPAARMFPSVLNEFLQFSGLAAKYPKSIFWGRADRTWADPNISAQCDWVPGAFSIIRKELLDEIGFFDEDFFLYFEEVDLCKRAKKLGWQVWYWPEIEVVHLGGESSKKLHSLDFEKSGAQLTLWRLRSQFLYHQKNCDPMHAKLSFTAEYLWHNVRLLKNKKRDPEKTKESKRATDLLFKAWSDTRGGRVSPPKPW